MSLKTCEVGSCKRPAAKGNPFCQHHAERIFRASKSINEKTSPNWLVDMERLTSEEEVAAYSRLITQMMHADAASVQAFREPMHISKAEWDARAAEGWKTTDVNPGHSRPNHAEDEVEDQDDSEENTSFRDALENVAKALDQAEKERGPLTKDEQIEILSESLGQREKEQDDDT